MASGVVCLIVRQVGILRCRVSSNFTRQEDCTPALLRPVARHSDWAILVIQKDTGFVLKKNYTNSYQKLQRTIWSNCAEIKLQGFLKITHFRASSKNWPRGQSAAVGSLPTTSWQWITLLIMILTKRKSFANDIWFIVTFLLDLIYLLSEKKK